MFRGINLPMIVLLSIVAVGGPRSLLLWLRTQVEDAMKEQECTSVDQWYRHLGIRPNALYATMFFLLGGLLLVVSLFLLEVLPGIWPEQVIHVVPIQTFFLRLSILSFALGGFFAWRNKTDLLNKKEKTTLYISLGLILMVLVIQLIERFVLGR